MGLGAGEQAFNRQMDQVTAQCRASKPAQAGQTVRTPGERGLQHKAHSAHAGVRLYPNIMPLLEPWAAKLSVPLPQPLG